MSQSVIGRFSIKQRLQSAKTFKTHPQPSSSVPAQHKIHQPEHYNYFMSTVQKELQHENNMFKKIKRKIDEFKRQKEEKTPIKNGCTYSHKCFFTTNPKVTHNRNLQIRTAFSKERFRESDSSDVKNTYTNSVSPTTYLGDSTSSLNYTKSASTFTRSPQMSIGFDFLKLNGSQNISEFQGFFKPIGELSQKPGWKRKKENALELNVSKPLWKNFQSYRICSQNDGSVIRIK